MRIINIPKGIQQKFLDIARFNTAQNIETCGILSGKLVGVSVLCLTLRLIRGLLQERNELHVTSLIIPNQLGTSDTCTTQHEEAIFEYQNKRGLMTFGWIHVKS